MKINLKIILSLVLAAFCAAVYAQNKPIYKKRKKPEEIWQRTFVAINVTPSFGFGAFGGYISPTFGYRVTENFNAAAGPLYMFTSFGNRATGGSGRVTASIWGGRIWAQHRIFRTFFAHGEYEVMNAIPLLVGANGSRSYIVNPDGSFARRTIGNPLLGVAFVQQGDRMGSSVTILYNLNYQENATPYIPFLFNLPIVFRASLNFDLGPK